MDVSFSLLHFHATSRAGLPEPENIPVAILHSVFIKGVTTGFDFEENDVEASTLYPELKFTTVDELLDIFLHDPPKPASAAFAYEF